MTAKYPVLKQATDIFTKLASHERCPKEFNSLVSDLDTLREDFFKFKKTCEAQSGLCAYLGEWRKIVAIIKNAVSSEREGNWDLHVATVQDCQGVYCEMDCCNYQR